MAHEAADQIQEQLEEEVEVEEEEEREAEEVEEALGVVVQEVEADFEEEGSQSLIVLELHKKRRRFYGCRFGLPFQC